MLSWPKDDVAPSVSVVDTRIDISTVSNHIAIACAHKNHFLVLRMPVGLRGIGVSSILFEKDLFCLSD